MEAGYHSDEEIPIDIIEESVRMAQEELLQQRDLINPMLSQDEDVKEEPVVATTASVTDYMSISGITECSVCCESFSKSRYAIDCLYCWYASCVKCCKYYILSTSQEAHCMNCRKKWNRAFLSQALPEKFIFTDYKLHRENMLLEREKAYLPATQLFIPPLRAKKALSRTRQLVSIRLDQLNRRVRTLEDIELNREVIENQEWLRKLLDRKIMDYDISYNRLTRGTDADQNKDSAKKFTMKCPLDECRGFLSQKYKCGICNTKFCSKCHESLTGTILLDEDGGDEKEPAAAQAAVEDSVEDGGDEKEPQERVFHKSKTHVCNPDTVESVNEIKKSTRNCPNCHVSIFKSSGCDQMWCIQCHTAFNWKTGQIEKGVIHNPEYFEFIRNSGMTVRNPYEQLCGGMPPFYQLTQKVGRLRSELAYLQKYYQMATHYRTIVLQQLPTPIDNVNNQDLRIDYLMNTITEEEFKIKLQRRQKEREHRLEYRQCVDTFVTVTEELVRQLYDESITIEIFIKQAEALTEMTNKSIKTICSIYKVKYNCM